jgi:hypothetical protein
MLLFATAAIVGLVALTVAGFGIPLLRPLTIRTTSVCLECLVIGSGLVGCGPPNEIGALSTNQIFSCSHDWAELENATPDDVSEQINVSEQSKSSRTGKTKQDIDFSLDDDFLKHVHLTPDCPSDGSESCSSGSSVNVEHDSSIWVFKYSSQFPRSKFESTILK